MNTTPTSASDDAFFLEYVDPWVRMAIADIDPWEACGRVYEFVHLFEDVQVERSGDLYRRWMELTDLMEIGRSSLHDRHTVVQIVAVDWLRRTRSDDPEFVTQWLKRSDALIQRLMSRDGNTAWSDLSGPPVTCQPRLTQ
jgi:hypothetical protein